jgi:hypothetical protein
MEVVDRLSTAPSVLLRVIRTAVIEPADVAMATIDARYMGALKRSGAEAKAAHERGVKQRSDTVTETLARLAKAANDLAAAKRAHDQAAADKQAADTLVAAKTAHDTVCEEYTDSQLPAGTQRLGCGEEPAGQTKARNDAVTQVTNSADHRHDLADMGKVVFDQLHAKSGLRRALDEKYSHEEVDRIEKEVVASATYEGQSMAQSGVYRAEHAMSLIWIRADTPGLRRCMLEGRTLLQATSGLRCYRMRRSSTAHGS